MNKRNFQVILNIPSGLAGMIAVIAVIEGNLFIIRGLQGYSEILIGTELLMSVPVIVSA